MNSESTSLPFALEQIRLLDEQNSKLKMGYLVLPLVIIALTFISQPNMDGLGLGLIWGVMGGLLLYAWRSKQFSQKVFGLVVPYITDGAIATWEGKGDISGSYAKYGLRSASSGEVDFKGSISSSIDDISFKITQMFDVPGTKKIGSGLIVEIKKKNRINSNVLVLSEKTLNKKLAKMNPNISPRKGFTDPEFEKLFEVYSRDGVDAQYILHPLTVEKLKALRQEYDGDPIEAVFAPEEDIFYIRTGKIIVPELRVTFTQRNYEKLEATLKEGKSAYQAIIETIKSFQ